jgi:GTP-binding protein Era
MQDAKQRLIGSRKPKPGPGDETGNGGTAPGGDRHLQLARESLRELVEDPRIPPEVRGTLQDDYAQVQAMLEKLEHGHVHIAVFGRVSVGKSATLNALIGEQQFSISPLHGETKRPSMTSWQEYHTGGVYLIDTPGINEVDGEDRERLAHEVASRADLIVFIVDGDITETEIRALRVLATHQRPILLVLNKCDRYREDEKRLLLNTLHRRTLGLVEAENLLCTAADPAEKVYITVDEQGRESESARRPPPVIDALRKRLWQILESEGKTLSALNASLFAGALSDRVTREVLEVKRDLAQRLIRTYCVAKGVAVALNPIPLADLAAAAAVDASMLVHLSKLYAMPLTRNEAGDLVKTIAGQMALLMGTVWTVHLISSALKGVSGGLSTILTAGAQGAVAYYATYVVGQAAERYFALGKSWGEAGPKAVVEEILASIDRGSILEQAREDILARLRS